MSNKAMSWAIECKVKGSHKLVLMLLADAHNGHTGECFPHQERVADASGLGLSTVQACIKDLEDWGLIERKTVRLGRGRGSRTNYVLNLEKIDPQILDVLNPGNRPPDSGKLDPQISGVSNKDKPEIEPEGTGTGSACAIADKLWDMAPKRARTRSSKDKTLKSVTKALAKTEGSNLIECYDRYLADPDVSKQEYAYVSGLHVWLNDSRWQGYEAAKPDLLTVADREESVAKAKAKREADEAKKLDWLFAMLDEHGSWHGDNKGYPVDPRDPDADYPAELYMAHGIRKRERAS